MMTKESILDKIRSSLPELMDLGVERIGLFGSYIRNEQRKDSDIDILIEFSEGSGSYINLIRIHDLLEDLLGHEIELVTVKGLSPYIGPHILDEVEYIDQAST